MKKIVIFSLAMFLFVFSVFIPKKELNAAVITNLSLYDSNIISIDDEVIIVQGLVLPLLGGSTDLFDLADIAITQGDEYYVPLVNDRLYVILNSDNKITQYLGYGFNSLFIGDTAFVSGVGFSNSNPNFDVGFVMGYDLISSKLGYIVEGILFDYISSGAYNEGYRSGYDNGYDNGYDDSFQYYSDNFYDIIYDEIWEQARLAGRQEAIDEADDLKMKITDFLPGVLGSIFLFFLTVSQIGILGITILDILGLIFMVGALVFVIRFFFKG